jgi:hypothetical protein
MVASSCSLRLVIVVAVVSKLTGQPEAGVVASARRRNIQRYVDQSVTINSFVGADDRRQKPR